MHSDVITQKIGHQERGIADLTDVQQTDDVEVSMFDCSISSGASSAGDLPFNILDVRGVCVLISLLKGL